jgi:ABC-2 type transport system permease protein
MSKLFVIFLSLSVFIFVSYAIYFTSHVFFLNLANYGIYGKVMINYMINAGIFLLLWFAVISSIAANITLLTINDKSKDYLLTLPIKPAIFLFWNFTKTSIANFFLIFFSLFPVMNSYINTISIINPFTYWLRFIFIIFVLVLISTSLGQLISFYLVKKIKEHEKYSMVVVIGIFIILSAIFVQFVFPKNITMLTEMTEVEFYSSYKNLPLVSIPIPTKFLSDTFMYGFSNSSLYLLIISLIFSVGVIFIGSKKFLSLFQILKDRNFKSLGHKKESLEVIKILNSPEPLVIKDWLSIIRSPQDTGYGLFLISLILFFFSFLYYAMKTHEIGNQINLQVFSFCCFLFFSLAYFLRLSFPLMAKEGSYLWYIFTLPLKKNRLYKSKILLSLSLSIPLLLLSTILYIFFIQSIFSFVCIFLSWIGILILSCICVTVGSIKPAFDLGDDPEKASTSISGIESLFESLMVISFLSYILYLLIIKKFDSTSLTILSFFVFTISLISFYLNKRLKNFKPDLE